MFRFRPSDFLLLAITLSLVAQGRPMDAEAQVLIPDSVVQMGECYNALDLRLRLLTGNSRQLPILPDRAIAQNITSHALMSQRAQPARAPVLPQIARLDGLQRKALREALSKSDAIFSDHLIHLTRIRAQAVVLGQGITAIERIGALADRQREVLLAATWPNWQDTFLLNAGDSACSGSYMQAHVASSRQAAQNRYAAFAFGEEVRQIEEVFEPRGGVVSVEMPPWRAPSCLRGGLLGQACITDRRFVVRAFLLADEVYQQRQRAALKSEDLARVHAEIAAAAAYFASARARFLAAFDADLLSVAGLTAQQSAALRVEREGLMAWRSEVDLETAEVEALARRVQVLEVGLSALDQELSKLGDAEVGARARRESARSLEAELRAKAEVARESVRQARQRRDALRLDCGGLDYAACADPAARAQYDEALFKIYEALTDAENEEWVLRDRLDMAVDERLSAEDVVAGLDFQRVELKTSRAEQRIAWLEVREQERRRREAVESEAADWARADVGNQRATVVVEALSLLAVPRGGGAGGLESSLSQDPQMSGAPAEVAGRPGARP